VCSGACFVCAGRAAIEGIVSRKIQRGRFGGCARSKRWPIIRATVRFTVLAVRSDANLYGARWLVLVFAVTEC
jgi:hypothetical protein